MTRIARLFALAAAVALVLHAVSFAPAYAQAQTQGASDPKILLEEIYNVIAETCVDNPSSGYDPLDLAQTYFTPRLAEKLNDASTAMKLDFDIFTDSQDCKVTDLNLNITKATETAATGVARFKNYGEERTIALEMTKMDGVWRVSDVVYAHREFSLDKAVD